MHERCAFFIRSELKCKLYESTACVSLTWMSSKMEMDSDLKVGVDIGGISFAWGQLYWGGIQSSLHRPLLIFLSHYPFIPHRG